MPKALQWLLSLIFIIQMYLVMVVIGLVMVIPAAFSRRAAHLAGQAFCRWVIWSARVLVGLKVEVRGTPPVDEVLIAAKHQSFLDIMVIYTRIPRGKFIMKRELIFVPVWGFIALRMGCVPVNRGKRGAAISKMMADVTSGKALPGQLVIYPQGTRVPPGEVRPYKAGSAILYSQLGQPCVPVATNIGLFWPKHGILRKRGTAVVEFMEPIPPGLGHADFMRRMEEQVEGQSNRLMAEAGFRG